ncbi:hypothetical protein C8_148 [Cannes 8 virus]|nr:hypothetical protein C8_148 [Cannes 8 virus]
MNKKSCSFQNILDMEEFLHKRELVSLCIITGEFPNKKKYEVFDGEWTKLPDGTKTLHTFKKGKDEIFCEYKGEVPHGKFVWKSGKTMRDGFFRKGLLHGTASSYYGDTLECIYTFSRGKTIDAQFRKPGEFSVVCRNKKKKEFHKLHVSPRGTSCSVKGVTFSEVSVVPYEFSRLVFEHGGEGSTFIPYGPRVQMDSQKGEKRSRVFHQDSEMEETKGENGKTVMRIYRYE